MPQPAQQQTALTMSAAVQAHSEIQGFSIPLETGVISAEDVNLLTNFRWSTSKAGNRYLSARFNDPTKGSLMVFFSKDTIAGQGLTDPGNDQELEVEDLEGLDFTLYEGVNQVSGRKAWNFTI